MNEFKEAFKIKYQQNPAEIKRIESFKKMGYNDASLKDLNNNHIYDHISGNILKANYQRPLN